ncbi:cell division protein GpsB [Fructilactobacillus lindneri]|uniref:Cell cycle protein gpsB n=2 Tax=Fructilactobacillus lindneri TaxID=53444 RepID=A0A0R2JXU3_9LACO|nr:cell division regulator GpsB [Fructilactobacillus lindneri]ANZ58188.1 cell division protein GpsB [Fructilactobacillus lindneri]ANZ59509.1 cell division protein GpsB [Fructilactobacillus lindneri]KRN79012.1 cell cycle protein gpsB [Fructilactobacillus lindneri DSM 20690 = JCM 11027]POG98707.1 cell division protein GpsB [Fructilactobacillus lindneri]POH04095.1 cell division protein GpsB [Fructilactobacillus lindneri]
MNKINFTPKEILQKEFKQKMRGYDPNDVDSFLDEVIKDYESFQKNIQEQDQQIDQLDSENKQLKSRVAALTNELANKADYVKPEQSVETTSAPQPKPVENDTNNNVTNMDVLRRLSNLERKVFGENTNN